MKVSIESFRNRSERKSLILTRYRNRISFEERKSSRNSFSEHKPFMNEFGKYPRNSFQKTVVLTNFSSIFDVEPLKNPSTLTSKQLKSHDSSNSITSKNSQFKRQKSRVDSLNNLLEHCAFFQEETKSIKDQINNNRTAKNEIMSLKKSIEKCEDKFSNIIKAKRSEQSLKKDAKEMSLQLGMITEKINKSKKKIWKFSTPAIRKKTEKLLSYVEKGLNLNNFIAK